MITINEPDQPNPTQPKFGPWGPNLTQNQVHIGLMQVYHLHLHPVRHSFGTKLLDSIISRLKHGRLDVFCLPVIY